MTFFKKAGNNPTSFRKLKNNEKNSTTAKGSKEAKFSTIDSKIHRIPSSSKRFFTKNVCNSTSFVLLLIASISTPTPIFEKITDKIPTIIDKRIKIVTGCGKRFEIAATLPKNPFCLSSILSLPFS